MRQAYCIILLLNAMIAFASRKPTAPPAPLPSIVQTAKRVFLANGGGSGLAYDTFYAEMNSWGKYQIVGLPEQADLIVELSYQVEHAGTRVWSSTNTYTGATNVYSAQIVDPKLTMTIYDAHSKQMLWSTIDHRRLARREKNREKEMANSAKRLVDDLKNRSRLGIVAESEPRPTSTAATQTSTPQAERTPVSLSGTGSSSVIEGKKSNGSSSAGSSPTPESDGTASITSNPDGAQIFVDSVGRGPAPTLLRLKPGKHKIQLVVNGYKDWLSEIEVKSGSIVNVTGNLEK